MTVWLTAAVPLWLDLASLAAILGLVALLGFGRGR